MVEVLILVLFLISGGATGWMGVHLLPQEMLDDVTDVQRVRLGLTGLGTGIGLVAGLVFKRLRLQLMQQVRTMPTDLLISRSVGLILGLLVANLLLAPILLLPPCRWRNPGQTLGCGAQQCVFWSSGIQPR